MLLRYHVAPIPAEDGAVVHAATSSARAVMRRMTADELANLTECIEGVDTSGPMQAPAAALQSELRHAAAETLPDNCVLFRSASPHDRDVTHALSAKLGVPVAQIDAPLAKGAVPMPGTNPRTPSAIIGGSDRPTAQVNEVVALAAFPIEAAAAYVAEHPPNDEDRSRVAALIGDDGAKFIECMESNDGAGLAALSRNRTATEITPRAFDDELLQTKRDYADCMAVHGAAGRHAAERARVRMLDLRSMGHAVSLGPTRQRAAFRNHKKKGLGR